uniref:Uncharacterized protein n=1 Tax=Minutocellus polymorphus TaxID=265543 RepID=A0A6U0KKB3_9STRA
MLFAIRILRLLLVASALTAILPVPAAVEASSPVFHGEVFRNALQSASLSVRLGCQSALTPSLSRHRYRHRSSVRQQRTAPTAGRIGGRSGTTLRVGFGLGLPIVDDILEPIELCWEFYTARDEIQEQMLTNAGKFLKKKSVQALGFAGAAVAGAEILARVGFIGDRGEGIAQYMKENEKIKERLRKMDDTIEEQMPGVMARSVRSCFRRYRALPERAKFAIAFSTGATLQQTIINAAVSAIKLSVGSFVVLETMAFCGIIGEPGESIVEYIDDHDDELKERFDQRWGVKAKKFRQTCRKYLSLDGIVELYEAAVDEEKVATFGMGLGMVAGSLV